ncbi:MAG: hypothetical protein M3511_13745 [Deinococcota bacterium]|jgi:hypothetical protein|nr:hypothetical protein [Deinococcota bacterium]
MPSHVLRSFLYLDQQAVNDYLAALGEDVQDESVKATTEKSGSLSGEGSLSILKGGGKTESKEVRESTKSVVYTDAAKFQRLYAGLEKDEAFGYYEFMDGEVWDTVRRNTLLELSVDLSLSKLGNFSALSAELTNLSNISEAFTGQTLLDSSAQQMVSGIESLAQMEAGEGIPILMNLVDSPEYKFAAYLTPDFLRVEKHRLAGQVTVFCKVQRKLTPGEKFDLFNPLKLMEKLQTKANRKQRRATGKSEPKTEFPEEFRDTIKAPGAIVTPVAIYK